MMRTICALGTLPPVGISGGVTMYFLARVSIGSMASSRRSQAWVPTGPGALVAAEHLDGLSALMIVPVRSDGLSGLPPRWR
jgi:hypothetical protein